MAVQFNNGVTDESAYWDGASSIYITQGTTAWGICAWVYRDSDTGTTEWPFMIATSINATPMQGVRVSNTDLYQLASTGVQKDLVAATLGTWVFCALQFAAGGTGNGWYGTSTTLTANAGGSLLQLANDFDVIFLGQQPSRAQPFKGRIDHVRVWSGAAPTKVEFEAEMVSATAVKTASLFAAYEFPANSGTYLNDTSGNARHMTASNIDYATNYVSGPTLSGGSVAATVGLYSQALRNQDA